MTVVLPAPTFAPALAPGEVVLVAPGVWRTRLPLPAPPSHVNCWLLEDGDGWLLVDTGIGTDTLRDVWRGIFASALQGRPITRVLATHFHADHVGLAGWVCAEWGAPLLMPRIEWYKSAYMRLDDEVEALEQAVAFHHRAGAPAAHLAELREPRRLYRDRVAPLPRDFLAIAEGQVLTVGGRRWQVMIGAGHAPEMACLWNAEDQVLIAADHILPRISPHVGVHPSEPEADPLAIFLAALARFRQLPGEALILPSHGEPFRTLHARIDTLVAHHGAHLDMLRDLAAEAGPPGITVQHAVARMFTRPMGPPQRVAAVTEALAHLHYLRGLGDVLRRLDGDGVARFVSA